MSNLGKREYMYCRKEIQQLLIGHSIYRGLETNQYMLTESTTTELKLCQDKYLKND